jgi:hypothetical protein
MYFNNKGIRKKTNMCLVLVITVAPHARTTQQVTFHLAILPEMQKAEKVNYYIQYLVRGFFLTWSVAYLSLCILFCVRSTYLIMKDGSTPIIPFKKIYSEDISTNNHRNYPLYGCMHVPAQEISDIRFSRHIIENRMRINLNFGNSPSTRLECLITFSCGATAKDRPRSPYCWGFYISHTHTQTQTQTQKHTHTDLRIGRYLYTAHHDEFETAIPAQAVADLTLRRHRHWHRYLIMCFSIFIF